MSTEPSNPWWGHFTLALSEVLRWQIGPLTLQIRRTATEWQILEQREADENAGDIAVHVAEAGNFDEEAADLKRYALRQTESALSLMPRLADRPVVVRPRSTFTLLPQEEVTAFISTPLWFEVTTGANPRLLLDAPIFRPSDTWFGPDTRTGQLCYASRTHARSRLEEVPQRPHRALTPVVIRNAHETPLSFDRLSLPVPFLSLYADAQGYLWTQAVTLLRRSDEETAELQIGERAPPQAVGATPLGGPRERSERSVVVRAWSRLFSRED